MSYAAKTHVPAVKSRAEIERMLTRFGATAFASSWDTQKACIQFAYDKTHVRFELPLPSITDERFTKVSPFRERSATARQALFDQEVRRLWRALALIVKAKIESVNSGVESFEVAFLAHVVAARTGETVGEIVIPRLLTGQRLQLAEKTG